MARNKTADVREVVLMCEHPVFEILSASADQRNVVIDDTPGDEI